MTTQTEERAQMSLEERPIEDMALQGALASFMAAKSGVEGAKDKLKDADETLSGMVGSREMSQGTYRVGPYIMVISDVAAHQRIRVKLAKT